MRGMRGGSGVQAACATVSLGFLRSKLMNLDLLTPTLQSLRVFSEAMTARMSREEAEMGGRVRQLLERALAMNFLFYSSILFRGRGRDPERIILIMIKNFALNLFRTTRTTPRFAFSTPNNKADPPEQPLKPNPQNPYAQDDDEDAEPEFQKEDRSTLGWTIYRIFFWGYSSLLAYNLYLLHTHDKKTPVEDEPGAFKVAMAPAKVIYDGISEITEFMTSPPVKKLMPDIIHPAIAPKTLVLNVTGTLLQAEYVFGKGLVVKKRPGLNQFLKKMASMYEIVLFSDGDSSTLEALIPSIDPRQQFIQNYFAHECMVLVGGRYIKDLKYLNRDLRNVVVIDKSKEVVARQKENVVLVSEYKGDEQDRELLYLSVLLENLAKPNVRDVRKALEKMGENPVERSGEIMRQNQKKMQSNNSSKVFGLFSKKN